MSIYANYELYAPTCLNCDTLKGKLIMGGAVLELCTTAEAATSLLPENTMFSKCKDCRLPLIWKKVIVTISEGAKCS